MKAPISRVRSGFTRADLIALVSSVVLLFLLAANFAGTTRTRNETTVCLGNLRRISQAMVLYTGENRGYLPHPSWGSDLTGYDNWAYSTHNDGRLPDVAESVPLSAEGRDDDSRAATAQRRFQRLGQLWPFLRDERVFRCPADTAHDPVARKRYRDRPQKLTSFCMNGAVIGFGKGPAPRTYPLSSFLGDAVAFWESDESDPFQFNDAGAHPLDGVSRRHLGGCHVGRFDGGAEFWPGRRFRDEVRHLDEEGKPSKVPNPLWCNPGSPSGGFL